MFKIIDKSIPAKINRQQYDDFKLHRIHIGNLIAANFNPARIVKTNVETSKYIPGKTFSNK